jgi:arylsulfatase A-like enzyme
MDDVGRINMGFARAGATPWDTTAAAQPLTPTIDAIALAGMKAQNMMAGPNCMPSRIKLLGMGESYRTNNLMGTVVGRVSTGAEPPWFTEVVINTNDDRSLFHRAKKHGYTTYGSGKMHFFIDRYVRDLSSIGVALGMDFMPFGYAGTASALSRYDDMTPTEATFLGQNCHVVENLEGAQTISSIYSTKEIMDHAVDHLTTLGATDSSKLFMYLAPPAPHYPNDSGATPADGCPSALSRNDRPPGDTTSNTDEQVFNSQIQDLDARISDLKAQLDLHPTTGQDILCVTSDNGIQARGAKLISEIYRHPAGTSTIPGGVTGGTQRWKSWPYPAGVQVPLVCEGKGIAAGTVITANIGMSDLNKTIDAILSGETGGGHLDGQSFASCLGSTAAADECEGQESICLQKFGPVGGKTGTWTEPPLDGELLTGPDWDFNWNLCRTGGHWLVRWGGYSETSVSFARVKDRLTSTDFADGLAFNGFNEEFFNEDRATNASQYFDPGDEIASTPFGFAHAAHAVTLFGFQTTPVPADGDTVTLNGTVLTFKSILTGAANEVLIDQNKSVTSTNLATAINNSAVSSLVTAGSSAAATSTQIKFDVSGAAGNTFTTTSTVLGALPTGTLVGGVDSEVMEQRKITISNFSVTPTDDELDALAVLQRSIDMLKSNGGNYGNRGGAF